MEIKFKTFLKGHRIWESLSYNLIQIDLQSPSLQHYYMPPFPHIQSPVYTSYIQNRSLMWTNNPILRTEKILRLIFESRWTRREITHITDLYILF